MFMMYCVEYGLVYEEFATYREAEIFCGERGIYAPDAIYELEAWVMYEYGLIHIVTGERNIIFGYSYQDACRRRDLNPVEWEIDYSEYVD